MAVSSARAAAFDILLQIEREDAYASELLHSPRFTKLSATDHGLTTEIVMGVLRWRSQLDNAIRDRSSIPFGKLDREVLTALRIAAYQLFFLERIPQRAAIHEGVELVKRAHKSSAAPFANAVLRKLSQQIPNSEYKDLTQEFAHPSWLLGRWRKEYGDAVARKICEYNQHVPQTTIRVFDPEVLAELQCEGIEFAPSEFLTYSRHVISGNITSTAAFQKSRIAIQDEGSQLVALLAGKGKRIMDCCAAPGGKARILASQNPTAEIVAIELHERRSQLLRRLVPAKNVEVITADVCNFPVTQLFDCVLADVPCSGTGTLAHNPEIKWRLMADDLTDLQNRQLAILQAAMRQVVAGGRLVYSTCSLETEENSEIIEKALAENPAFTLLDCTAELRQLQHEGELRQMDPTTLVQGKYLRTIPGVHPCDGFFAAVLQHQAISAPQS